MTLRSIWQKLIGTDKNNGFSQETSNFSLNGFSRLSASSTRTQQISRIRSLEYGTISITEDEGVDTNLLLVINTYEGERFRFRISEEPYTSLILDQFCDSMDNLVDVLGVSHV